MCKELHKDESGDFYTSPDFWDCECKTNYIHPKEQPQCEICGSVREEQPDSRMNEIQILKG